MKSGFRRSPSRGRRRRPRRAPDRAASRERGDRGTAKRFGADRGGFRIGDELCDERGIAALALGRPGCGSDEEALPRAFASGRGATAARRVRPVQVVDREQRRLVKGHVGGEPVQAVEDREGALGGRRVL